MKHRLLLPVCLLGFTTTLNAAAHLILPPPPEGWEGEVTPGFEPSIEKAIIDSYYSDLFHVSLKETLRSWGPAAIPVIIKLHKDDKWADYRRVTARMLVQSESPEARRYFLERFRNLADIEQPTEDNAGEMGFLCVNLVDSGELELIQMLIAEARSGNVTYAPQYAEALLRLGTDHALDAMRILRARLPESPRDAVNWRIGVLEARARAQEPMPMQREADTGKRLRRAPELRKRILAFKGRSSAAEERKLRTAVKALVDAEGDRAARFLKKIASDPDLPANVRTQAVVGLGLIGTDKSAKAFARLRRAALKMPWAPEPRQEYTHAQKMAEAAALTVSVIPYMGREGGVGKTQTAMTRTAWVSDDLRTGHVRYGDLSVRAARVGTEWLVVDVSPIPIP